MLIIILLVIVQQSQYICINTGKHEYALCNQHPIRFVLTTTDMLQKPISFFQFNGIEVKVIFF